MIKFCKCHSYGNSFVILEEDTYIKYKDELSKLVINITDPLNGLNTDGVLFITQHLDSYKMVYYNNDGTYGKMCGNGIRCFIDYLYKCKKIPAKGTVYSDENIIEYEIGEYIDTFHKKAELLDTYKYGKKNVYLTNSGVLHATMFVDKINVKQLKKLFDKLNGKYNTSFVHKNEEGIYEILTYEVGAGLTLACGTAAISLASILNLPLIEVQYKLGIINVKTTDKVNLSGYTVTVCMGDFKY